MRMAPAVYNPETNFWQFGYNALWLLYRLRLTLVFSFTFSQTKKNSATVGGTGTGLCHPVFNKYLHHFRVWQEILDSLALLVWQNKGHQTAEWPPTANLCTVALPERGWWRRAGRTPGAATAVSEPADRSGTAVWYLHQQTINGVEHFRIRTFLLESESTHKCPGLNSITVYTVVSESWTSLCKSYQHHFAIPYQHHAQITVLLS